MQFKTQCGEFGEQYNLDIIEKTYGKPTVETPIIDSPAAFNEFMFQALRFTEQDKHSISR